MKTESVLSQLKSLSNLEARAGMARFGINPDHAYGISIPKLQQIAKGVGRNRVLASELWASGIHEARILACMVEDPQQIEEDQLESWVLEFNSWDLCDQCCNRLFSKTVHARAKALQWAKRDEEFVKRAGFVLMAVLAVHDRKATDDSFDPFLELIASEAADERNFVKKAVNWALRQIGKRNLVLNKAAVAVAEKMKTSDAGAARWIAADALRELTCEKVQKRIGR